MRITLGILEKLASKPRYFRQFSNFPMVLRDLSLTVNKDVKQGDIEDVIRTSVSGGLLRSLRLYDRYEFNNKEDNKISYTYALSFHSDEKTLTSEEINAVQEKIIQNLSKKLNAELRK